MTEGNPTTIEAAGAKRSARVVEYVELTKPRLTMLSVLTTLGGFYMASQGALDVPLLVHTIIGTSMCGAGCGALNMFVEREHDAKMRRTMQRPLPSGRLIPAEALLFGLILAVGGVTYLALAVNLLTAILGAATVVSYVLLYTPLKRLSTLNTVVGAIPGALPPVMGWAAVRGSLDIEALVLFALLFFWQMPHFLALAWMYRNDYERAGYKILSVLDRDGGSTSRQILLYTSALLPVSLLGTTIGMTGPYYFYSALALGVGFLALGLRLAFTRKNKHAKHLFYYSLLYLPLIMLAMALDRLS
ncbi:MAG TPA: heme o synthase [Candidatus Kapabacteria bacterium]|nr:heme o synthase [Candidatus Kapabacteria bacterium]